MLKFVLAGNIYGRRSTVTCKLTTDIQSVPISKQMQLPVPQAAAVVVYIKKCMHESTTVLAGCYLFQTIYFMESLNCLMLKKNNKRFNKIPSWGKDQQTPTLQRMVLLVTAVVKMYSMFIFQNTDREGTVIFIMFVPADVTPAVHNFGL